jgi:hypothetical protein
LGAAKITMPTVKELLEHIFTSSDEDDGGDRYVEPLPSRKKSKVDKGDIERKSANDRRLNTAVSSYIPCREGTSDTNVKVIKPLSGSTKKQPDPQLASISTASRCDKPGKENERKVHKPKLPIAKQPPDSPLSTSTFSGGCGSLLAYTPFAKQPQASSGDISDVGSAELTLSDSCKGRLEDGVLKRRDESDTREDSDDSGGTSKRGETREPTKTPWNTIVMLVVQEDMDPTEGAIASLIQGAKSSNGDLNATFQEGKVECLAGQVIMDDDVGGNSRCQMGWGEYYPILQVRRIVWHATLSKGNGMGVPRMVFHVTDGVEEMPMVASTRKHSLVADFWSKKGPYETGVLREGKIFKLLDYHTGLKKDPSSGKMVACIFAERVRPQPKRNLKRFRTIRAFVKENIFE